MRSGKDVISSDNGRDRFLMARTVFGWIFKRVQTSRGTNILHRLLQKNRQDFYARKVFPCVDGGRHRFTVAGTSESQNVLSIIPHITRRGKQNGLVGI